MKTFRTLLLALLTISAFLTAPFSGRQVVQAEYAALPTLAEFASRVRAPANDNLAGIYADGVFAYPVVQQPGGNAAYVSNQPGVLTSFSMARLYDTTGLLAHNTLAGADFDRLYVGQTLTLVYANGEMKSFEVAAVERYQALTPNSPYSEFTNLGTPGSDRLSASGLFNHVYTTSQRLVLQTCIAANGIASWGRLFVIAIPKAKSALPLSSYEPMPSWYIGHGLFAK